MADTIRIRKVNVSTRDLAHIVISNQLPASASPQAMDVGLDGTIYLADYVNHVVYKIFEDGRVEGVLVGKLATSGNVDSRGLDGSTGLTARLTQPLGLCVDNSGNIYVGSSGTRHVRRLSSSGRSITFVGAHGVSGDVVAPLDDYSIDGSEVRMATDTNGGGMDVDLAGIVYVADSTNNKIKKFWPSGHSTVLAGQGNASSGMVNATGNAAAFNDPKDVAVDQHGTVYVADTGNNRIRKITEDGVVTTLAGNGTASFVDGNGITATFNTPTRLALDPSGRNLYVLDLGNSAIRRVDQHGTTTTFMAYQPLLSPASVGDVAVDASGFIYLLEKL